VTTLALPGADHRSETIGHSVQGRALIVEFRGDPRAPLRIFILAGQHGDEPDARDAARDFLAQFHTAGPAVQIAVVADSNPDGCAADTRRNARDLDLNRDHLLLAAPETAAIHAFARAWKPDLVMDIHTYRPWRKELLPFDFVFPQEIMFDFPTNPAVRTVLAPELQAGAAQFLLHRMADAGIRCDRYTLIRPGVVRHSTAEIFDARNGLAMRLDVPAVLLEGRRSSPDDVAEFMPPRIALLRSMEAVADWAAVNSRELRKRPYRASAEVPLRYRYSGSKTARYMEMQSAGSGAIDKVELPGNYLPVVKATRTVTMPDAYAVPRNHTTVMEVLDKHGFTTAAPEAFSPAAWESYRIDEIAPVTEDDPSPLPSCTLQQAFVDPERFVLYPSHQTGGSLLALLLEPESQFGPWRLPELTAALQPGTTFPVIRVTAT
jgi:hypothetical protein